MDFAFYIVTSIRGFTSMITLVCTKTIILKIFSTEYKRSSVIVILFVLTTLKNAKNPCRSVIVDDNGAFSKSADVTNLLVDQFIISIEIRISLSLNEVSQPQTLWKGFVQPHYLFFCWAPSIYFFASTIAPLSTLIPWTLLLHCVPSSLGARKRTHQPTIWWLRLLALSMSGRCRVPLMYLTTLTSFTQSSFSGILTQVHRK